MKTLTEKRKRNHRLHKFARIRGKSTIRGNPGISCNLWLHFCSIIELILSKPETGTLWQNPWDFQIGQEICRQQITAIVLDDDTNL
jgi:hypothetical protein